MRVLHVADIAAINSRNQKVNTILVSCFIVIRVFEPLLCERGFWCRDSSHTVVPKAAMRCCLEYLTFDSHLNNNRMSRILASSIFPLNTVYTLLTAGVASFDVCSRMVGYVTPLPLSVRP